MKDKIYGDKELFNEISKYDKLRNDLIKEIEDTLRKEELI